MSGMEIPLILGAGGALVGSQVDKKNPLRGALLGGAAGGLGGAALAPAAGATGVGSATAASQFGTLSAGAGAFPTTAGTFGGLSSAAPTAGAFGTFTGSAAGAEAATAAMMAGTNQAVNAASQAVAGNVANPFKISPAQAMAAQRVMGGFEQPQGGTSTQTAPFRPGQQVNLADPIASLLAPKRKKERPMISLL